MTIAIPLYIIGSSEDQEKINYSKIDIVDKVFGVKVKKYASIKDLSFTRLKASARTLYI